MYAMNSREFKYENHSGVFHGTPLSSIQTHEKNIMKLKKYIVQVGNGFPTYEP